MDNKKVENKKQMSNKKKFWVGMSALAAVGAITATVAWFTANQTFNSPNYASKGYSVSFQHVFDTDTAKLQNAQPGQSFDETVAATNEGENPVLVRITYNKIVDGETTEGVDVENDLYPWAATVDMANFGQKKTDGHVGDDKAFYYTKPLNKGETATHLSKVTLQSGYGQEAGDITKREQQTSDGTTWQDGTVTGAKGDKVIFSTPDLSFQLVAKIETIQATDKNGVTVSDFNSVDAAQTAWKNVTGE